MKKDLALMSTCGEVIRERSLRNVDGGGKTRSGCNDSRRALVANRASVSADVSFTFGLLVGPKVSGVF